jgi:hypothetical protein
MTYKERLEWLDREVDKAFSALEGFLAERKGHLDADAGYNGVCGIGQHLEKHRKRYELGLNDGRTLLLIERSEHAASTNANRK